MAIVYPEALDDFVNPLDPQTMEDVPHDLQHSNANDAIEAIEEKLGIDGSLDENSIDFRLRSLEENPLEAGGENMSIQFNDDGVFGGFGSWDGSTLAFTGSLHVTNDSDSVTLQGRFENNDEGGLNAAGFHMSNGGWDIVFRTIPNVAWFDIGDSGGNPMHQWVGQYQYLDLFSGRIGFANASLSADTMAQYDDAYFYAEDSNTIATPGTLKAAGGMEAGGTGFGSFMEAKTMMNFRTPDDIDWATTWLNDTAGTDKMAGTFLSNQGDLWFGNNNDYFTFAILASGKIRTQLLTESRIIATDADRSLQSLDTDTYPSLVELAFVKGVTSGIQGQIDAIVDSEGQANGIATLDGAGKVPVSQLPSAIFIYKGTWNASTNTPSLSNGTGVAGWLYRVTVAGTQNLGSGNISFEVGDYVIHNGTAWEKSDTTDAVSSINGMWGDVTLDTDDIAEGLLNLYWTQTRFNTAFAAKSTTNLAEGTNQYFTNARALAAVQASLDEIYLIQFSS